MNHIDYLHDSKYCLSVIKLATRDIDPKMKEELNKAVALLIELLGKGYEHLPKPTEGNRI